MAKVEAEQIQIDTSFAEQDSLETFIKPYRDRINEVLDSTLAYAPFMISKDEGNYNTPAGNLMADIVLSEAIPIYKARTGHKIDFVVLNHGGIRSIISKGKVSARSAFEVMPFENSIAVVELSGKSVQELVNFLVRSKRAHPISGIQIILDTKDKPVSIKIQGESLDINKTYHIATSDYLVSGGDDMIFFKDAIEITSIDYLIRNAMIDYFKKVDTLTPVIDDRFYKLTN